MWLLVALRIVLEPARVPCCDISGASGSNKTVTSSAGTMFDVPSKISPTRTSSSTPISNPLQFAISE